VGGAIIRRCGKKRNGPFQDSAEGGGSKTATLVHEKRKELPLKGGSSRSTLEKRQDKAKSVTSRTWESPEVGTESRRRLGRGMGFISSLRRASTFIQAAKHLFVRPRRAITQRYLKRELGNGA